MLTAYFWHSCYSQMDIIVQKEHWLAACIALRVVGAVGVVFSWSWRKICTILQPMGCYGAYLKKCPKPCWPVWSKEVRKYTFCSIKSLDHQKIKIKTCRVPYLGLELTMQVLKSEIHLVRQSLWIFIYIFFTALFPIFSQVKDWRRFITRTSCLATDKEYFHPNTKILCNFAFPKFLYRLENFSQCRFWKIDWNMALQWWIIFLRIIK